MSPGANPVALGAADASARASTRDISPWCFSPAKRLLDVLGAAAALVVLAPVMLAVAAIVKLTSPGPVLFRQKRVGQDGREFELLKFRTMTYTRAAAGPGVTRGGDHRVTRAGRVLRQTKLDELPQFFNVLRGDMSLVGPRPDLAEYLATLDEAHRPVLALRPGITSAASLRFRDEESVLAAVPEAELLHYYIHRLLPQKVEIDLNYARRATWHSDFALLASTAAAIISRKPEPPAIPGAARENLAKK